MSVVRGITREYDLVANVNPTPVPVNTIVTTNNTPATLYSWTVTPPKTTVMSASVVANLDGGSDSLSLDISGSFQDSGGTAVQIGTTTYSNDNRSGTASSWVVDFATSGQNVLLRVTGANGQTISWSVFNPQALV